jgi:hypothetical protein
MRSPTSVRDEENTNGPKVGIFWLVAKRLMVDSTPLDLAEEHARCKTHGRSHLEFWQDLTRAGATVEGDYEEHPRGRIVYDTKTRQFTIYADKCIIRKKAVVREIMREMNLPGGTKISTDSHYRCFACLQDDPAD